MYRNVVVSGVLVSSGFVFRKAVSGTGFVLATDDGEAPMLALPLRVRLGACIACALVIKGEGEGH